MSDFRLNPERYSQARSNLQAVEHVAPNPELVQQETQALLASASKAKRALIAADSAQSLLMYHACNLDRQLEVLVESPRANVLSTEQIDHLRKVISAVSDRLQRTENYAHACRSHYLPQLQQHLEQLEVDPQECVSVIIND